MIRVSARQNFDGDVVHRLEILTPQWCGAGRAKISNFWPDGVLAHRLQKKLLYKTEKFRFCFIRVKVFLFYDPVIGLCRGQIADSINKDKYQ